MYIEIFGILISSEVFGVLVITIMIAALMLPIIFIVRNVLATYPTRGSVKKTAQKVSGKYKKQMDAFIEKSGGSHWGTCESCSSVCDTRKHSRCPSCGGKLVKAYKVSLSFTVQQFKEYRNCVRFVPFATSNEVLYNAAGLLTQYRMVRMAEYISGLVDNSADSFEFKCDFCGSKIQIGDHNCPHCGAPFGKDKEFIMRNKIIVQDADICISEEAYAELFIDSQRQIRWWIVQGRKWTPPYVEEMGNYIYA